MCEWEKERKRVREKERKREREKERKRESKNKVFVRERKTKECV